MKLTDEQWSQLEELAQDIARAAGEQDPMPWDGSYPPLSEGIRERLSEILECEHDAEYERLMDAKDAENRERDARIPLGDKVVEP
jgi:hypothetical protein